MCTLNTLVFIMSSVNYPVRTCSMVHMSPTAPATLGATLKSVRDLLGRSLKSVSEPAGISAAYLMKLERDEVVTPSPHVLRRLADELGVEYLELMRLAGYVDAIQDVARPNVLLQAIDAHGVTDDEARAVAAFLEAYRAGSRRW